MVKIVRNICPECNEPIVRACERCAQWNARVRSWYAGDLDRELTEVVDGFAPVPRAE